MFCVDAADRGRLEEAKAALDRALGEMASCLPSATAGLVGLKGRCLCTRALLSPASCPWLGYAAHCTFIRRGPGPVRRPAAGAVQQARLRGGGLARRCGAAVAVAGCCIEIATCVIPWWHRPALLLTLCIRLAANVCLPLPSLAQRWRRRWALASWLMRGGPPACRPSPPRQERVSSPQYR